jgi:endonuclease/exonuclease/phosphatase family metal-dependent hydrolase
MKKFLIFFAFIFIIISCTQQQKVGYFSKFDITFGDEESLEIMTWNIQHFPKDSLTISRAASAINELDVDVVGLQEIEDQTAFEELVEELNSYRPIWQGYRAVSDEWDQNLAFVYKQQLNVENIYEIYLEEKYDYALPRRPLVLEFEFANQSVVVINNHLKARGGRENEDRRRAANELLQEFIETNYDTENVVLIGDLNDEIAEPENKNVFWNFINKKDDFLFADTEIAADSTAKWSYPYWRYRGHIDHILITNELFDEFAATGSEVKTITLDEYMPEGWDQHYQEISDHRPVAIKLIFAR